MKQIPFVKMEKYFQLHKYSNMYTSIVSHEFTLLKLKPTQRKHANKPMIPSSCISKSTNSFIRSNVSFTDVNSVIFAKESSKYNPL